MPPSFPLTLDDFFDPLPVASCTMRPVRAVSLSETGDGEVITHQLGTRLWEGKITLGVDYHAAHAAIEARMSVLEEAGASLLVRDTRQYGPMLDPTGALLRAADVRIRSLNGNRRDLTLKDLFQGYEISQGNLLSFTYGTNPLRYALHRVVRGRIANASGDTGSIELTPFIRPGAAVDAQVRLVAPFCKAVIVSADYGNSSATVSKDASFNWRKTLR